MISTTFSCDNRPVSAHARAGLRPSSLALALTLGVSVFALSLTTPISNAFAAGYSDLASTQNPDAEMELEAAEITYDFDRDIIVATGSVQVLYDGYTVEASQIEFDRGSQRLVARGNVIMTEPDGNIVRSNELTLSENFAAGFANALQIDTPNRTQIRGERVSRTEGEVTTLENGVYTVYTARRETPYKPPLWHIRAGKIIHNKQERRIYFEDASFELFGVPIAYLPYLSMPDPSVKRKSGFLSPSFVNSSRLGTGGTMTYYWALDPSSELTTALTPLSRQGALADVSYRRRFESGTASLAVAGIKQLDPEAFSGSSGDEDWRIGVRTTGSFSLSSNWDAGWDITYKSDRAFLSDYNFTSVGTNETSKIYLDGSTERNALSIEAYMFDLSQEDYTTDGLNDASSAFSPIGTSLQDKQALVLPVVDYDYVFADPILDGELSITSNFTSLTRAETDAFQATGSSVDRFRGIDGTFSRFSLQGDWRRTYIDPIGQVFTPFVYARGDMYFLSSADKNVTDLTGSSFVGRFMPAAGLEYKFPIIATFDGGNQIVSPIAQIIVRPNETNIGELPNEDAQSIVFDTTTLFDYDKFSGFDRSEGGTRANIGLSYKLQLDSGYYFSALAGRSYQIAGTNSYEKADISGSTLNSGLETQASDYVASFYLDTQYGVKLGTQARFDDEDFELKRLQTQATATYGPVVSSFAYAFLGAQPDLGINDDRQEIISSASLRLFDNWRVYGSLRYDLESAEVVQDGLGVAYDDEGFSLSLTYAEDRSRNNGEPVDRTLIFRFGLRTLGDMQYSKGLLQE